MKGTNPLKDDIAKAAAAAYENGEASSIEAAIAQQVERMHGSPADRPSRKLVRRHMEAQEMAALGMEGFRARRHDLWETCEILMTTIEHAYPDASTSLVGRAARGEIVGGIDVHIRFYGEASIADLASLLVEHEVEEPRFETIATSFGRLNRVRFSDAGYDFVLTRIEPGKRSEATGTNVFTGLSLVECDLATLRAQIQS